MAKKGDFVDERDKGPRAGDALAVHGVAPGMHARWVRTKGYNADSHMDRMREMGYEPVRRTSVTQESGNDPRLTSGQHGQLDGTVKRGDLMLMQCSQERHEQRRQQTNQMTQHRTRATLSKLKSLGGHEE